MQRTSRGTAPASTTAWESSEKKNVRDLSVRIKIKELVGDKNIDIEVDGGINLENVRDVKNAGANVIVSGSTIFKNDNYKKIINDLRTK